MKEKLTRREMLKTTARASALSLFGTQALAAAAAAAAPKGKADDIVKLPQVPRRVLGKTGETVPILLMGMAMKLDQRFDPKLAEGMRFGVNYFDAADCYGGGTCETAVGGYLTKAGNRKDLWITSKSDQHDPKGFEETVNTSLEKMKTDYADLYYLHALTDANVFTPELKATVERLKKEKKFRFFGFSCHDGNVAELLQKAAATPWVDSVMFRYNFRQYGNTELNKAIDACVKANVGLIAMKTQGSEASFTDAWQKFTANNKWTKHQAVLKAVWADERITAAVSHMDTFEKLKQNIAAAIDDSDFGAADFKALEEYAAATRAHACDGCDHLCGAAVDAPVRIGAAMRCLMYHDVYGDREKALEAFRGLPAPARRLGGVDFSRANAACPHGVDVAAHMRRAAELFEA